MQQGFCTLVHLHYIVLIVSGNVESDPGPMKKCPKCEKIMPTRSNNCKCGHLLGMLPRGFCTLVHSLFL